MKRYVSILVFFAVLAIASNAIQAQPTIKLSGYVDTYIATDDDQGNSDNRLFSVIDHQKHNFGLNTAQFTLSAEADNYRSYITLHHGDIADNAWTTHSLIQQAFAGVKLFNGFWLDGGYFLTHIGGESLLPKDNWLSSHSMVTYYEPFYQAGFRATYQINDNLSAQLHLLNGNGRFQDNNEQKTLGWWLGYTGSAFSASYAGQIGNEENSGDPGKNMMYHNICFSLNRIGNFEAKAQLDYSMKDEGKVDDDGELATAAFMGASAQARFHFADNFKATARLAYFDDSDNLFASEISGIDLSAGIEFNPTSNSYLRLEGRMLSLDEGDNDEGKIFFDGEEYGTSRMELLINFGLNFDLLGK